MTNNTKSQTLKIKAAVLRKQGGPLKVETLEMEGPRDDEILVRLVASGICHTDIDFIDGWYGTSGPAVLGHEGAGIVELAGKKVKGVRRGDHVVLSYQSCGRCGQCRKGMPYDCERLWELNFDFHRLDGSNPLEPSGVLGSFFGQSSFATYTLATERNIVKVPKTMPLEVLAPLGCGLQTGAGTVINSLKARKGKSIAVFGTGAVGLAAVMAARAIGANPIIGVDIRPGRLKLAMEAGATHVIDSRKADVASRITGITGSGVDYVVEDTGELTQEAVEVLNPKGTAAFIAGGYAGRLSGGRKALSIIQGSSVPQTFIPKMIKLYRAGKFPFDRLIRFYKFEEINKAIRDAKRGDAIKPVLRMGYLQVGLPKNPASGP